MQLGGMDEMIQDGRQTLVGGKKYHEFSLFD
jgi:hypothetical protein